MEDGEDPRMKEVARGWKIENENALYGADKTNDENLLFLLFVGGGGGGGVSYCCCCCCCRCWCCKRLAEKIERNAVHLRMRVGSIRCR